MLRDQPAAFRSADDAAACALKRARNPARIFLQCVVAFWAHLGPSRMSPQVRHVRELSSAKSGAMHVCFALSKFSSPFFTSLLELLRGLRCFGGLTRWRDRRVTY